ncbi:transcription factor TGA1-like isoform X2 [Cornus florida]|uniref:transcription factor TGA1-like isoform X2 n=1 Tax=Cornus florida TaxID=4283 RepID=UPI00289F987B|nr:transcription factor TGA1-like isoform X2 [Cornus florida]
MNSPLAQFVTSRGISIFEPIYQSSMWEENFRGNIYQNTSTSAIVTMDTKQDRLDSQSGNASLGMLGSPRLYDQEAAKPFDKVLRRLAQNREAARKSRLRKKAYVQQLETSRLKLIQLEQELERARQQGSYIGGGLDASHVGYSRTVNSGNSAAFKDPAGIAVFEVEYGHWVEEQNRQICELRNALYPPVTDKDLRMLVDCALNHYFTLFRMRATAAKADVFYMMFGMCKTSAERFFLWIGGFRPSELLRVLEPQLAPLTDQQHLDICKLRQSCQQAEDAFSQGMEKLKQNLAESVAAGQLGEGTALERLEALVRFVNEADHLRQETLQQMSRILTTDQAARALIALGEYFQRLRALSSLWANPREPA